MLTDPKDKGLKLRVFVFWAFLHDHNANTFIDEIEHYSMIKDPSLHLFDISSLSNDFKYRPVGRDTSVFSSLKGSTKAPST